MPYFHTEDIFIFIIFNYAVYYVKSTVFVKFSTNYKSNKFENSHARSEY